MFYTFGNMKENPFPITAYKGPEYFCDRQDETGQLKEALLNERNITLFSPRRMGKTGLIHHLFNGLKNESVNAIYTDIFGTEDLNGFINKLANAVLNIIPTTKDNILKKALDLFGSIRPQISYNALSGIPQISFTLQNDAEKQATLGEIPGGVQADHQPQAPGHHVGRRQQQSRFERDRHGGKHCRIFVCQVSETEKCRGKQNSDPGSERILHNAEQYTPEDDFFDNPDAECK